MEFDRFLHPANPKDFLGHRKLLEDSKALLSQFHNGKTTVNLMIVTGDAGVGKSSFLNLLQETAQTLRLKTEVLEPQLGESNKDLIQKFYSLVEKYSTRVKKLFGGPKPKVIPEFDPDTPPKVVLDPLYHNLKIRKYTEDRVLVFMDNINRLIDTEYEDLFLTFLEIAKHLAENKYPFFIIMALSSEHYETYKEKLVDFPRFTVERFDFAEAEVFLRKMGPDIMRDAQYRKECVKYSDRTAFNLMFICDVNRWVLKKFEEKGQTQPSLDEIKSEAFKYIRQYDLEGYLREIYQLEEDEINILQTILHRQKNYITFEALRSNNPDALKHLKRLEELGLVFVDRVSSMVQIKSYGLYEKMGGEKGVDVFSESILLLQVIEQELISGSRPSRKILDRLYRASLSATADPNLEQLGLKSQEVFKNAFERNFYYEAYKIAIIGGNFYISAQNFESAGIILEDAATKFHEIGKTYYSTELLQQAMVAYQKAGSEWKYKSAARECAILFQDMAEEIVRKNAKMTAIARSYYFQAARLFYLAGEKDRVEEVGKRAVQTYEKEKNTNEMQKEFFLNLLDHLPGVIKIK